MRTTEREGSRSTREQQIFERYPVPRAVAVMVVPAIISQVIHVVYNLADTWFVGLTGDPNAVAAVSLVLPVYNMMTGISNLFGIGGASVIARALGRGDTKTAGQAFSVSCWWSVFLATAYALILLLVSRPLLMMIGGDAGSIDYAVVYTLITVIIGGIPTILSTTIGSLIRANGDSQAAGFGMSLGAFLNIALDPLFMFVLLPKGNEVIGAAVATALANGISLLYFAVYLRRHRDNPVYSAGISQLRGSSGLLKNVVTTGIPGFCMIALAMLSNCFLNSMISAMGSSAAVAGIGIVRKIDSLAYSVNQGVTQGMLPLVSYCYASGKTKRMKAVIAFSTACTVAFSLLSTIVSFSFAPQLISVFIPDADTIRYGASFLRILCLAIPIYSPTLVIIAVFQAVGQSAKAFVLTVLRKGSVDILLLFLFRAVFGEAYILWASPVMETVGLVMAVALLLNWLKRHQQSVQSA